MYSEHKVTVRVELADGTIIQEVAGFNSGNPRYHIVEMREAVDQATVNVDAMLVAKYGDIRELRPDLFREN